MVETFGEYASPCSRLSPSSRPRSRTEMRRPEIRQQWSFPFKHQRWRHFRLKQKQNYEKRKSSKQTKFEKKTLTGKRWTCSFIYWRYVWTKVYTEKNTQKPNPLQIKTFNWKMWDLMFRTMKVLLCEKKRQRNQIMKKLKSVAVISKNSSISCFLTIAIETNN